MTQPSGWYDDPQDPSQLRYWDGVVWTSHVSPKVSPTVEQSHIGMPFGVLPASARPQSAGSSGAQGAPADQGGFASPQQGQGNVRDTQQGQGQPGDQWSQAGQGSWPQAPQQGWQSHPAATTPDGVVLSGWWKRVLARILDNIIVGIVALPLVFVPLQKATEVVLAYMQEVMDAAQSGSSTMPEQPTELTSAILLVSLIVLAVHVVYEVAFLTAKGATPGKMVVGISVRLRDKPGPPPLGAVLKRTAVQEGGNLVGVIPAVGILGSLFSLVDSLWPLWDDKKQAIHDKAAATNVVVGRQPRRNP